eukprot:TRINITY_DN18741_c0_g1_i1.p1 TRINITY_DN18741_c0_g1~~TRINITY_DN18741_c0_g1_i1.p1  ORF type:complete len:432 (+),score=78.58 TRINITY_DN18741_c0_g1_i1:88-1296(+)
MSLPPQSPSDPGASSRGAATSTPRGNVAASDSKEVVLDKTEAVSTEPGRCLCRAAELLYLAEERIADLTARLQLVERQAPRQDVENQQLDSQCESEVTRADADTASARTEADRLPRQQDDKERGAAEAVVALRVELPANTELIAELRDKFAAASSRAEAFRESWCICRDSLLTMKRERDALSHELDLTTEKLVQHVYWAGALKGALLHYAEVAGADCRAVLRDAIAKGKALARGDRSELHASTPVAATPPPGHQQPTSPYPSQQPASPPPYPSLQPAEPPVYQPQVPVAVMVPADGWRGPPHQLPAGAYCAQQNVFHQQQAVCQQHMNHQQQDTCQQQYQQQQGMYQPLQGTCQLQQSVYQLQQSEYPPQEGLHQPPLHQQQMQEEPSAAFHAGASTSGEWA